MTEMMKDPFTGKMVPRPPRRDKLDLVDPKVLPAGVTGKDTYPNDYNDCLGKLASIREQFAKLTPGQRSGKTGDKLLKDYRHETLRLATLSGEKAPPIWDGM